MTNNFENRTVLISGASSGIGRAVADHLLAHGANVIGLGRDQSRMPGHERFQGEKVDLADIKKLPAELSRLSKTYPDINAMVCCAGAGQFGSLEEFSFDQINALINLNLTGQIYLVRQFLPLLRRHKGGDIIMMGSEAALSGGRKGAVYCASKFGLRGFVQALRDETAKSGIRICLINPGMVKTPFFDQLSFAPGDNNDNYIEPEDVAAAVELVLSARSGTVFDEINLSPQKKVINFSPEK